MLDRLVIENLRRNKAFDAGLKSASRVDKLADEFADAILFETDSKKRAATIKRLGEEIVSDARKVIIPQAEKIGRENAVAIVGKTPTPTGINLANETERRTALFEGKRRTEQRLAIIRQSIDAEGQKLDARLARYWLEPAEGTGKDKLERLREIHNRLEERRKGFESALADYNAGKINKRPSKPSLDFLSEMTSESKKEIRIQARRTATDTEVSVFKSRGHKYFVWIVPNGHSACPDCRKRANVKLSLPEWERLGRPGSGLTICGEYCFCMLIPVESVSAAPQLVTKIETAESAPMTTKAQQQIFNANRIDTPTRQVIQTETKKVEQIASKPAFQPAQRLKIQSVDPQSGEFVEVDKGSLDVSTKFIFGKNVSAEDIARLSGAPDGSVVNVSAKGDKIDLFVTHDELSVSMDRSIYRRGDKVIVHNNSFYVSDPEMQGKGIGIEAFGRQVDQAREIGVNEIQTSAAKGKGFNGYYTWARFGYDANLEDAILIEKLPPTLQSAKRVSDLMKTPEGREWWKANGDHFDGVFTITKNRTSLSERVLNGYIEAKRGGGKSS